jgi:hypothetical protein
MDFKINMMDLCDMAGGMYNAVDLIITLSKKYKFEVITNNNNHVWRNPKIIHYETVDSKYDILPGDNECISGIDAWSYGFLRTHNRDYIVFTFHNADEKDLDITNFKQKKF